MISDALTPTMVSLRCDRNKVYEGEILKVEAWICNDLWTPLENAKLCYQIEKGKEVIASGKCDADMPYCDSRFQGYIAFKAPKTEKRTTYIVRLLLQDQHGRGIHESALNIEVFKKIEKKDKKILLLGKVTPDLDGLVSVNGIKFITKEEFSGRETIFVQDIKAYEKEKNFVDYVVEQGAKVVFMELPEGKYVLCGQNIKVKNCSMLPLHFASRVTGHVYVNDLKKDDVKYWYDDQAGYVTPLLDATFEAEDFCDILISGNQDDAGSWQPVRAAAGMLAEAIL